MENKSFFLSLYSMVIADGLISPKELEFMYNLGREVYQLSEDEINKYIVSADVSFVVPETVEDKVRVLYQLAMVAWADQEIDIHERDLLKRYVIRYQFEEENADGIVDYLVDCAKNNATIESVLNDILN
ncbi:MAG: TerB family tellurite resistance protein [Bacteroidales bacterium]|nr:TerB family tellurite resistance protein [Bacteroidales bacterium]